MKHTKRYMVIFNKWDRHKFHEDKTEYDTIAEANEEARLLEEVYADTPRPKSETRYQRRMINGRIDWYSKAKAYTDYIWGEPYMEEALWGYVIIDFENEEVVKWGHDQLKFVKKNDDIRRTKDRFFLKEGEIPSGYKWDNGEYEGWLQFRWGNGRNSIELGEDAVIDTKDNENKCVRHCSIKKKKYRNFTYDESEEAELDRLNEEILLEEAKVSSNE